MKIFLRYLGYLLVISSFFRAIPIAAGFIYNEPVTGFVLTFLASFAAGGILIFLNRKTEEASDYLTLKQGLLLGALSFILLPFIGAFSYLPTLDYNFLDAFFESISGFTTTGSSVYSSIDTLPKSLLLWRAETQWMGGVGIIMVFLFLFSQHQDGQKHFSDLETQAQTSMALYQAQGFPEKLDRSLKKTLSDIMFIYTGYTFIGIALLCLAGMTVFEAIGMTFTSLSTGGFSMGSQFYSNSWQLLVLAFLMIVGAISFITHDKLLRRKWKAFLSSFEKNIFLLFLLAGILITLTVFPDFKLAAFELVSAFTTTGYNIHIISLLPQLFIFIMMIGMIVGGSAASTAGGIKVNRIYYLLRAIPWHIKKLSNSSNAIIPLTIHEQEVGEKKISNIGIFVFGYFFILLIGTLIFMLYGFGFLDASFQMISSLGNVGLQTVELAALNPLLKSILIIAMLFGRLEIFPLLILLRSLFKKRTSA